MVSRSPAELADLIRYGLANPEACRPAQEAFLRSFFGEVLDGKAGYRIAAKLLELAKHQEIRPQA